MWPYMGRQVLHDDVRGQVRWAGGIGACHTRLADVKLLQHIAHLGGGGGEQAATCESHMCAEVVMYVSCHHVDEQS